MTKLELLLNDGYWSANFEIELTNKELKAKMLENKNELIKLFKEKVKEAYMDGFGDSHFDFDIETYLN